MRRWDDLFSMLGSARDHVRRFGYGLKPYRDTQRQMIGVICEETHIIWQIELSLMNNQLKHDSKISDFIQTPDGLRSVSRMFSKNSEQSIDDTVEKIRKLLKS